MSRALHCVNCRQPLRGKFCAHCGEKRIELSDLTVRHFLGHAFEACTHVDGKIYRTVRSLLFRPGELTADYLTGRRRPYIGPLQLFLICNLAYFLLRPVLGWDTLSSTLGTDMEHSAFASTASQMVSAKLAASQVPLENYRAAFDPAAILLGKSLVILLVLLYALPLALLFFKRGRPALTHLVFALHFGAFFLLALIAGLGLLNLAKVLLALAGYSLTYRQLDLGAVVPLLMAYGYYFHQATHRVYGVSGWSRGLQTFLLTALMLPVLTAYRFVLFLITLWTT